MVGWLLEGGQGVVFSGTYLSTQLRGLVFDESIITFWVGCGFVCESFITFYLCKNNTNLFGIFIATRRP